MKHFSLSRLSRFQVRAVAVLMFVLSTVSIGFSQSNQSGSSCFDAVPIPNGSPSCLSNVPISGNEKWFAFTANSQFVAVKVTNPNDTTLGHVHRMELFSGNCNGLVPIASEVMIEDSAHNHDSTFVLYAENLVIGNTYYVRAYSDGPTSTTTCRACQKVSSIIDICVEPLSAGCNFWMYDMTVCPNGGYTNYSGHLTGLPTAFYFINNVTMTGNLALQNITVSWSTSQSSAILTAWTSSQGSAGPSLHDNNEVVYLSFVVPPGAQDGDQACITIPVFNNLAQVVCSETVCITVNLNDPAGPDLFICPNFCVTLTATGGTGYTWTQGNTVVGTTPSVTVCPSTTTTYNVALTGNDNCYKSSDAVTVNVIEPNFTFTDEVCEGQSIAFTNTTNFLFISNYTWDFGDGSPTVNSFHATHTFLPGTYSVTLTATNNYWGCSTSITKEVHVSPSYIWSDVSYNPNCCSSTLNYTLTSQTINSPADATNFLNLLAANNNNITIKNYLVIKPGQTLSLNNVTIQFGMWGGIIVEPGATLNVNGSTLRGLNVCGTMWQGIEVWGNPNFTQTGTGQAQQGKLNVTGGIIQDAHNAIIAGKTVGGSYDLTKSGGIVNVCCSAQFNNNAVGIKFAPYAKINTAKVRSSSFNSTLLLDPAYRDYAINIIGYVYPTNNPKYAPANPTGRTSRNVYAWGVRNVLVQDNTFNNAELGFEIYNAQCRINKLTATSAGNSFSNMVQAISASYYNSSFFGNDISSNKFDNITGSYAVEIMGGKSDRVKNNVFNFLPTSQGLGGMLLNGCSYFQVKDNTFNRYSTTGILCRGSGSGGGTIGYDAVGNTFNNCKRSVIAMNNNSNLKIHCNQSNNVLSNYISNWNVLGVNASLATQGNFVSNPTHKDPAGNKFDPLNITNPQQQINSIVPFVYFRHNITTIVPNVNSVTPDVSNSPIITVINSGTNEIATSCTQSFTWPPTGIIGNYDQQLGQLHAEYNNMLSTIDNGQTATLLTAINSNMAAGQLKNMLLAHSPLSDEVLLAVINRFNPLPAGHFKNVIDQNSPVSDNVKPVLYAMLSTLPSGIANQIKAAQANNTNRTLTAITRDINNVEANRQELVNYLLINAEDNNAVPFAISFLEQEQRTEADQTLAATYLVDGNLAAAATKLNAMSATTTEDQAYIDLQEMLLGIAQQGKTVYDMDAQQEQLVRSIAALEPVNLAAINAQAILKQVFGEEFPVVIPENNARLGGDQPEMEVSEENYLGQNFPNPFTGSTFIPYYLPEGSGGYIKIYSIDGKLVDHYVLKEGKNVVELNTAAWTEGIFVYSIEIDGLVKDHKRMVVIGK